MLRKRLAFCNLLKLKSNIWSWEFYIFRQMLSTYEADIANELALPSMYFGLHFQVELGHLWSLISPVNQIFPILVPRLFPVPICSVTGSDTTKKINNSRYREFPVPVRHTLLRAFRALRLLREKVLLTHLLSDMFPFECLDMGLPVVQYGFW